MAGEKKTSVTMIALGFASNDVPFLSIIADGQYVDIVCFKMFVCAVC